MTPTIQQINHDLNFLYLIARTVLPKDILEGLMYGSDFEEPTEEDFKNIQNLIIANTTVAALLDAYDYKLSIDYADEACHICGGFH